MWSKAEGEEEEEEEERRVEKEGVVWRKLLGGLGGSGSSPIRLVQQAGVPGGGRADTPAGIRPTLREELIWRPR